MYAGAFNDVFAERMVNDKEESILLCIIIYFLLKRIIKMSYVIQGFVLFPNSN